MLTCAIVQPIDEAGYQILRAARIEPVELFAAGRGGAPFDLRTHAAAITREAGVPLAAIIDAPGLRVIGVHGAGINAVPVAEAARRGIAVVNTPLANVRSVAEHAMMLIFALAKRAQAADAATRRGDFGFKFAHPTMELEGLTLGLVGFGAIGKAVAAMARAFGMDVMAISPRQPDEAFAAAGVTRIRDLGALFRAADVVSLHAPATPQTFAMIGAAQFGDMKPGAIFINTSRGSLVDEAALIRGLRNGRPWRAGLDVFATEPLDPASELAGLDAVLLTPHAAASSVAALRRMAVDVATGVVDVLADRAPRFPVAPPADPTGVSA